MKAFSPEKSNFRSAQRFQPGKNCDMVNIGINWFRFGTCNGSFGAKHFKTKN